MLNSVSLPFLFIIFGVAAIIVWIAGIQLSNTTDELSQRFGFGQALGGLIFLAIATNLPEIAITGSAALTNNLGIAIGNILGGVAIQTVVLVLLDAFALGGKDPLSYMAASLVLVLEGILVVAVLVAAIMGTQLPNWVIVGRISPDALIITILWIAGLWLLNKARRDLPWKDKGHAPLDKSPSDDEKKKETSQKKHSTVRAILVFTVASLFTLLAGVALEVSGDAISTHIGLSGVIFGATFLAAATALPEVSTGFGSIKLGDYQMAVSDIFGGNAFLPVLFLLANILSSQPVLPEAQKSDIYLASLGCLLTTVYLYGLIFRPQRQYLRMGIDSIVVLIMYILGIIGLIAIAHR